MLIFNYKITGNFKILDGSLIALEKTLKKWIFFKIVQESKGNLLSAAKINVVIKAICKDWSRKKHDALR